MLYCPAWHVVHAEEPVAGAGARHAVLGRGGIEDRLVRSRGTQNAVGQGGLACCITVPAHGAGGGSGGTGRCAVELDRAGQTRVRRSGPHRGTVRPRRARDCSWGGTVAPSRTYGAQGQQGQTTIVQCLHLCLAQSSVDHHKVIISSLQSKKFRGSFENALAHDVAHTMLTTPLM